MCVVGTGGVSVQLRLGSTDLNNLKRIRTLAFNRTNTYILMRVSTFQDLPCLFIYPAAYTMTTG